MKEKIYDVIVLGGGAAGLMSAFTAGQRGLKVLVLEKSNKVGKKILMSGGGRCNFTNQFVEHEDFISRNINFCRSALTRFGPDEFINLVHKHEIPYVVRKRNQMFCKRSSKDILDMLLMECDNSGVEILTDATVNEIEHGFIYSNSSEVHNKNQPATFKLEGACETRKTKEGFAFAAKSLIVATGALSIPTLGGSGYGYEVAKNFSIQITDIKPGLVPFVLDSENRDLASRISGVSIPVSITCAGQCFEDDMLFTHRGLSGPAVLQISSYWSTGIPISINLLPRVNLQIEITRQKEIGSKKMMRTFLATILPKTLVIELEKLLWLRYSEIPICQLPNELINKVCNTINQWVLTPVATEGYRTAEVTIGGISTALLDSKTMEYKKCPGLYFIGEVVDVSGHLGGYNFQWAWSSGFSAGQAVS